MGIAAWAALCAGVLWAFDSTDDYVGWPLVIAFGHVLFAYGTGDAPPGSAELPPLRRRIALGVSCAGPMISPLFVALSFGPGGLDGLDRLVFGLLFGAPVAAAASIALITRITRAAPNVAARRAVIAPAIMIALAWVLAFIRIALGPTPSGGSIDVFIVPIIASLWLIWAAALLPRAR